MIVQAEDMAKAVRVAIDMNHNSTPLLADEDVDTESFDEINAFSGQKCKSFVMFRSKNKPDIEKIYKNRWQKL